MIKTETKTETNTERIIDTNDLSDLISDKIGRRIEPKRIRSVFRNDPTFNNFDDGRYTSYKFRYPSGTVDRIIKRFIEIESERTERKQRSDVKRTERKNRSVTVLTFAESGNVSTERIKTDKTVDNKPTDRTNEPK